MLADIKTIPIKFKFFIFGLSGLIFLCLNFGMGFIIHTTLTELIQEKFGLFLAFTSGTIDYFVLSSTPIVGMLYHSKRKQFNIEQLLKDEVLILVFTGISFVLSLFIIAWTGKSSNILLPEYLRLEPFFRFSTLSLVMGMSTPFILYRRSKNEKHEE